MKKVKKRPAILLPLCALGAGLLNGMLGTGGGIPLWFVAMRRQNNRSAFATSATGVLALSLFSLLLDGKGIEETMALLTPFFLLAALAGGTLGGLWLGKIKLRVLNGIFGVLLVLSGIFVLIKEFFFA
ncbi:MAG: TSUP family transporter [Clostridia bacterium]|nr:TSUP family transporter [Clostridia bacterium]